MSLDELHIHGLFWIDKGSMGWVRGCWKDSSRPVRLECVSRVEQGSVGLGVGGCDGKRLDVV